MRILSIETSCDDTGVTIFEARLDSARQAKGGAQSPVFKILANNVSSQVQIHIPYGGVYPALAKREHIKNLPLLLEKTLREAKLENKKVPVDLITVTSGPGLEPALWTGIVFAKELAKKWSARGRIKKVPVVPVNHMEGHILSVFGKEKGTFKIKKTDTPVLALLVSGGHTELVLVEDFGKYKILGQTLDDAAGEAFDKVARMLGLPYPGGPEISRLAENLRSHRKINFAGTPQGDGPRIEPIFQQKNGDPEKFNFPVALPRPMLYTKNFDFSFSGLKTAVLYLIRDIEKKQKLNEEIKSQIALEFENAVIECLVHKTKKAVEKYKAKTLIVGGGVAANKYLQHELKAISQKPKAVRILFPGKGLTGDNSIMIGMAGYLKYLRNKNKKYTIKADGGLRLS